MSNPIHNSPKTICHNGTYVFSAYAKTAILATGHWTAIGKMTGENSKRNENKGIRFAGVSWHGDCMALVVQQRLKKAELKP